MTDDPFSAFRHNHVLLFESPTKGLEKTGWTICREAGYRLCTRLVTALQGAFGGRSSPLPYTVTLPYPPFGQNHTLKARVVGKRVQFYDDPIIKEWQAECRQVLDAATPMPIHVDYRYGILVTFFMPDDRRDIDSMEKKVLDILTGYAYYNDRRIFQKVTQKVLLREMTPIGGERGHIPVAPCVDILVWRI